MTAKTSTQRQKEHKTRMKEAGFERLEVWVHPDDRGELKRFAQFLQSRRLDPVLKSGA